MPGRRTRPATVAVLLVILSILAACTTEDPEAVEPSGDSTPSEGGFDDDATGDGGIRIEVVSSQPDRVSGSEARVRVTLPAGVDPSGLELNLDDTPVTDSLREVPDADRPTFEGVIDQMVEGNNVLTARAGTTEGVLRLRVWPRSGPIISGPQAPLLVCTTEDHGLGAPTDDDCSAPTRIDWSYISTDGTLLPLDDPATLPSDVARGDLDDEGEPAPLIVRTERGVINRAVYEIASLDTNPKHFDPQRHEPIWNGRLVYRFGDGCAATHGQGRSTSPSGVVPLLSAGYAVATATFNTGSVTCDDVVSAETTMMVKERFIELFGLPELTIGEGSGGGAAQVHLMVQNYPDLLDAAVAVRPLPDMATTVGGITDCMLLQRYYRSAAGQALGPAQRTAINGHLTPGTCSNWDRLYGSMLDPTRGCAEGADAAVLYHRTDNPTGVRCTIWDAAANQYGRNELTGHGQRPLDNFGIQYGLNALNQNAITFEQFLDLNRSIGGFDADGRPQTERTEAEPQVVQTAYETGRVSTGVGDQKKIPILEVDLYADPSGDPADRFRAFSLRDRLVEWGGTESVPGIQIWTRPADPGVTPEAVGAIGDVDALANLTADDATTAEAVGVVDSWATDLLASGNPATPETIAVSRPDAAVDSCRLPGGDQPVGFGIFAEGGECAEAYPISGDPRTAAGAPQSNDVIKCNLKAVDVNDYEMAITQNLYEALLEVFPLGVCDWELFGVGQTTPSLVDRTYEHVTTPGDLA